MYSSDSKVLDKDIYEMIDHFKVFNEEEVSLDRKITNKSLSMGQMQKIAFIRALLSGVNILILDESTSNLDESSKNIIFKVLKDLEITIINSTHNKDDFKNRDLHIDLKVNNKGEREIVFN